MFRVDQSPGPPPISCVHSHRRTHHSSLLIAIVLLPRHDSFVRLFIVFSSLQLRSRLARVPSTWVYFLPLQFVARARM